MQGLLLMATLAEISSFARAVLQTDDTDLTDEMLLVFGNDSTERIVNVRNIWPHLYSEGTLAVVASDGQYALNSASFTPQTFTYLESVWDDNGMGRSLVETDYQEATAFWIGNNQTESDSPGWFSIYGGNLYLYPRPSASRTYRVGGYREPTAMTTSGTSPDLPTRFHNAIQYGVVSLALAQTEDYEGAQYWAGIANQAVNAAMRAQFNNTTHRPAQMHGRGGPRYWWYRDWIRSMVP